MERMMKSKMAWRMLVAGVLSMTAACGALTEPKPLIDEFTWEAVENPNDVMEGVTFAPFFTDISFLGQMKTPTLCYAIKSTLNASGNTLDLRVEASSTNSPNCAQSQGGYRYQGVVRNLSAGSFTMKVTHVVPGSPDQVFTKTIVLSGGG
jgi:hypothetical protein